MDKGNTSAEQKIMEKTEAQEKSLSELKAELLSLSRKLEISQIRFTQLHQQQEVLTRQEMQLKKQAYALNERAAAERGKLEEACRKSEANVEEFVGKVNRVLERNKHLFEVNGKQREDLRERQEQRKRYYELKGENEALLLFKEYQECVMEELQKLESFRAGKI